MKNRNQELISAIGNERDIEKILHKAYTVIKNPLLMIDLAYVLQAYSPNKKDDDPLWNEITANGRFSHETVDFFKSEGFIESYATNEKIAPMRSDKLKYNRVSCTIYDPDGKQLGSICLVECEKPFTDEDFELLVTLCDMLGVIMSHACSEVFAKRAESITSLIEGEGDINKAVEFIKESGVKTSGTLYVCVVDVYNYDATMTHLEYFCYLFSLIDPRFSYFSYLNNVIMIFGSDVPLLNIKKEFSELKKFFNKYNINAGVSGVFHDIKCIKRHFRDALNSLNYATSMDDDENIFFYDDYKMGLCLDDSFEIETICHPIALKICAYDAANGTEYLKNLHSYCKAALTNSKSLPDVKRIATVFGVDFSDDKMLFSIYVSIKYIGLFPERKEKYLNKLIRKAT